MEIGWSLCVFQKNLVVWKLGEVYLNSIISLSLVSEELSSVETGLLEKRWMLTLMFQKNLVVWKQGGDDIKYEVHPISWSTLTFGMKPRIAKFLYTLYGK